MGTGPGVLPTGTVTFLLTDVEASTAAWQRAPESMPLAIARHDVLLDQAITAQGGVRPVEQGEGDSMVAAFERPSDAIAAALDAQRALQGEPWPEGAELRVRMALHTGEIVVRGEGNYAGTTLHRCARLRACAHGGQVVVSRATADLLVDRLPDGAALLDLGPHQLKDLVRPEHVYQLVHPDLVREFPVLRSLDAVRHNLPHQLTPLIGRVDELAAIATALDTDRLVTLTGSAGIGKTRLAVHAAAERAERHPDGVAFVELATISDPGSVASRVAGVLRVWETTTEATEDAIARFVADRNVLVVLDNCEHVIEACADLADQLLSACPQLTILATSREPLGVPGEVAWRVPPLPTPPSGQPIDLVEISKVDAARLFGDRARRARPGFAFTEATAAPIAEICRRLDGIPLALELAAARCRVMTPAQIAEELDRRFLLLTGGARTALARQQTLVASIEWSYDLLAGDERTVFRRLGVFSGPFPLTAAEAVCADGDADGWAVFDVLSRLVDKSLVVHDPETGWYQMLETIRLYALDRCREVGELEHTRDRHATWWAAWLDAHHPDGPSDGDLDAIHRAYPNLRIALQWAAATQPELALELGGGLGIYWYLKGVLGDAVSLSDLALASSPNHSQAWARAVGRVVMPRYYANDARFMTEAVGEARVIAEASGDSLTPVRCRACRVLNVDPGEFRELARQADAQGDLWVAARLNLSVAFWDLLLGGADAEGAAELDRVATIAEQLDATSLRLALLTSQAAQLAADLQVREAIARLDQVMTLADRASPTAGMIAFGSLAWYGQLCGEPASLDRAARVLAGSARDWGAMSALAAAVQGMGGLLAGSVPWDGREVVVPTASAPLLWVLADAIGEHRARLSPVTTAEDTGDVARLGALVMAARSAFREGRFREAEAAAAELVRLRSEDRHFWLLMLARCATGGGSSVEAARLLGAVAGTQERYGLPWLPRMLLTARAETEELCRASLGDGFDRGLEEGSELDLDDAVAYAVRARGERKRPSTGWDSLTPTELQVVEQVAAGRSNPEIAEALLMGRTTVKTHLGHIFTKLGMTNRAELAAEAARRRSSTPA